MSAFGPLISADWLHEHIDDHDVRVIDFRWYLVGRKGAEEYAKGHIPAAAFVELDDVTGKGPGRHPLPTLEQFQAAMRTAGVDDATAVVIYDDVGGSVAARLWFLLRWFGHERQAVLDGGLQAWGGPLETAAQHVRVGGFTARRPDRSRILDFDEVAQHRGVPVIDSRAGERYRGEAIQYLRKKYGEDRVAQIVTFSTIKAKSGIRDAARVMGYPYGMGDRLAKMFPPPKFGKRHGFKIVAASEGLEPPTPSLGRRRSIL